MEKEKKAKVEEHKSNLKCQFFALILAVLVDSGVTIWYCVFFDNTGSDLFTNSELLKDIGKLDWFVLFCVRIVSIPIRILGKRYGFAKLQNLGFCLWILTCTGLLVKFLFVLFAEHWKDIHHWIPLFPALVCSYWERLSLLKDIPEIEPKPQSGGFQPLLNEGDAALNDEKADIDVVTSDEKKQDKKKEKEEKDKKDEDPPAPKMKIFKKLVGLFLVHYCKCLFGLLALLAVAALGAFAPYIFGKIIDSAANDNWKRADFWLVLFFASGISAAIINLGQAYVTFYVIADVKLTLKKNLLSAILHQETGYFDEVTSGELTSRINNDCNEVTDRITWTLRTTGSTIFTIIWTVVFAIIMNVRLTVASFVCLPLVILSSGWFGTKLYEISRKETDLNAKTSKTAQEAIGNVRTVKSFACEDYEVSEFNKGLLEMFGLYKYRGVIISFFWSTYLLFPSLSAAVVLFFGVILIKRGELSLGQLASFMVYQETIMNSMNSFGNQWTQLISALGSADKIFKIIEREPKVLPTDSYKPEKCDGEMEMRDVFFAYPKDPDTPRLKKVNLKVKPGQIVALVGPSGGGKSTILSLLEYFYKPQEGTVLFDGRPVSDYDPHFLHDRIAIVDQTPTLFARSISENIAYGNLEEVSQDEIVKAAKMANAHEFILNLSKGYDTEVGERGVTLSGGQRQRISIARALVRKPTVLLLDEATASLDSESEHLVHQAIDSVMKHHTVLIVAHRLSTVKNADVICVVDKGEIVERGSHDDLLAMGGVYSQLIEKQVMK